MRDRTPRRVLVLVNHLGLGGTQINAVQFAAAVREHGYESLLIGPADTLPTGPSLFDFARERDVRIEQYVRPDRLVRGARTMSGIAAGWEADLVHVYGSGALRLAYWGPCLFGRRPLVHTSYEMEVSADAHRAHELIVGTGYLADDLRGRRGPTTLISPPVDLDRDAAGVVDATGFVQQLGLPSSSQLVTMVTRLDEEMKALSVEIAIASVERLGDPAVVLVVVGAGDARHRLEQLGDAVNARLGRRAVVFAGPMSDPRQAYASAQIVVGMGGSAARALAFGVPLVVVGEFGWSGVFTPEDASALFRNGFWTDERLDDPVAALTGQIAGLLKDKQGRAALGEFGRSFAVHNFGTAQMTERLAGVYERALTGSRWGGWIPDLGLELRLALLDRPTWSPVHAPPSGAGAPMRPRRPVLGSGSLSEFGP